MTARKGKTIQTMIDEIYSELPRKQQVIADFIQQNPSRVVNMSISEFAEATGNKSESAIVRFYRNLGFTGYFNFKVSLATEIAGQSFYYTYADLTSSDNEATVKEKLFNGIVKTLYDNYAMLDNELLNKTVNMIIESKRIFFIGYGESAYVCESARFKFMRIGFDTFFSSDSHFNTIQLSEVKKGDLLFAISLSGLSKDVVVPIANCKPTAKIIALTSSPNTPLGQLADICLEAYSEELNYRTDALMARHAQYMIMDILFMATAIKMGGNVLDRLDKGRQSLSYLKF
ncbi:MAG: MurR/RpiR family transcriptional regulator [Bacteroidia bacterium]|nr:MurR/RpiR family transcriptional regulator [Bacteroidia bacterium]